MHGLQYNWSQLAPPASPRITTPLPLIHPQLPLPARTQRIDITHQRTFQQPSCEPLGEDWGLAERRALEAAPPASAAAVREGQTNADPAVAQLRRDVAAIERIALDLPDGDERNELLQGIKDLLSKAESAAAATNLAPTKARAGKQQRRQNGRPDNQRLVTALLPRAGRKRGQPVAQEVVVEDSGDAFQPQQKKGKATYTV